MVTLTIKSINNNYTTPHHLQGLEITSCHTTKMKSSDPPQKTTKSIILRMAVRFCQDKRCRALRGHMIIIIWATNINIPNHNMMYWDKWPSAANQATKIAVICAQFHQSSEKSSKKMLMVSRDIWWICSQFTVT